MKKFHAFIEEHKERFFRAPKPLPDGDLEKAEKQFGFKFDDGLKEFFKYGYLHFSSVDLYSIKSFSDTYNNGIETSSSYQRLETLQKDAKRYNKPLPSDKIVPIRNLDDFQYVYSFGKQNPVGIYLVETGVGYENEGETLEEHVLNRFNEELEEILYEEENP